MKNQKKDINFKDIWKWLRSEKGKRYRFVVFYVCFFIFLFIFISVNNTSNTNNNKNEKNESSLPFVTSNLETKIYSFIYTITCPNKHTYNVIKDNKVYTFKDNDNNYIFELINGELKGNNNILYKDFSNVYFLRQVIKNSKLISETKLTETNEYLYNYKITKEVLSTYLEEELTSEEIEIIVKTNSNKEIQEVNIKLNSNCEIQNIIGGDNE